jgi:hypothetical protein
MGRVGNPGAEIEPSRHEEMLVGWAIGPEERQMETKEESSCV